MTKILVNNVDRVELPIDKLVNVVVPSADVHKIEYKGRVPLTIEMPVYHAERVKRLHEETRRFVDRVLRDWENEDRIRPVARVGWHSAFRDGCLKSCGTGICHVVGLIDLVLKFQDMKIPIAVIHPESGLHPKIVGPLTDVLIELAWRGADEELRFEMLARKAEIRT